MVDDKCSARLPTHAFSAEQDRTNHNFVSDFLLSIVDITDSSQSSTWSQSESPGGASGATRKIVWYSEWVTEA